MRLNVHQADEEKGRMSWAEGTVRAQAWVSGKLVSGEKRQELAKPRFRRRAMVLLCLV